ncbi:YceD family protein [Gynurincola endophyticus]|jgi:uncharacterized metal-binding protein YceD (DUF177 family)|uniref:YceD family protein n=1 Tax=Gynurincola endophyticus TaxID=2479004 RepID=UPI000F8E91F5|nr:DUF177 domain-containing protein [Gynurincola endophyticus]
MDYRRNFDIAFVGLKPGVHEFNYELNDEFFLSFHEVDFRNTAAKVKVMLDKHHNFMQLKFEVGGTTEVTCDRCGNDLPIELWDEFNLIVKLVEEPEKMNEEEEDPDIFYISKGESHLHLAPWLYEFVILSIPMQRMCGEDEKGKSKCNPEVLAKLNNFKAADEQQTNPIWKGLDQFKDLND